MASATRYDNCGKHIGTINILCPISTVFKRVDIASCFIVVGELLQIKQDALKHGAPD